MRTPVVAANWKMHKTQTEARQFLADFLPRARDLAGVEIVICPPFTALAAAAEALKGTAVGLGAQNMSEQPSGAFTGEVSGAMLADAGCRYVILGHSERRRLFGEDDRLVGAKVRAALQHNLIPILCIGETLEEQQAGEADAVNRRQLLAGLEGLTAEQVANLVIAYEPVWAIGTGEYCDAADANQVIARIRQTLAELYSEELAQQVRIQYGGSVKPGNIREFMEQPEIDGALVGGASLDAEGFASIVRY